MSTAYFGLICRQCRVAYPLGQEIHRDLKYQLDRGPFELECFHCGAVEQYPDVTVWEHDPPYPPTTMGAARQRVHRAKKHES